ncbi:MULTISPECIES: toll/interleukin-1 receptor domain-containing protein [unclassified Pseudomonas]|uniref:toll/interleukin-1 receptor domain-containing protein n=1 Tax=unclassified Pseudomonas TaxID=196821 RepID=UPI000CD31FEC|nr:MULTISPECIES: toll/interleukin-1 receptor domain-containing protein [unclassified Pseudomonas]POA27744.1 toll-Interleukin receptor [Pseudomonas sp. FW305-3-2-15-E-TSA4]POA45250.1 toll-Interleukin receptor [Pseudomonas sp. FW305-3-2-15-E-TSA2]
MAFVTKEQARAAARRGENIFDQVAGLESFKDERFDIFLSHSIKDKDLVEGVGVLLRERGYNVYIDWMNDEELDREHVDKKTADRLRQRMRNCSSLIYIATGQSAESKWMPWELGYFDGCKSGAVAILPLVDSLSSGFNGQEYLSLYPLVEWQSEEVYVDSGSEGRSLLWAFVNDTSR